MACLKCGRETDQMFCEHCRETMEKYPVKSSTFVFHLRENKSPAKWTPVRLPNAVMERQIQVQQRHLRRLAIAVVVLVILLVGMGISLVNLLQNRNSKPVGQNYNTVTTPTAEETSEPETTAIGAEK